MKFLDKVFAQVNTGQCGTIFRQHHVEVAADVDSTVAPVHVKGQDMAALRFLLNRIYGSMA